jgi:hypothetical protein
MFSDFDLSPNGINFQTMHLNLPGISSARIFQVQPIVRGRLVATLSPNPIATSGQSLLQFNFNWSTCISDKL